MRNALVRNLFPDEPRPKEASGASCCRRLRDTPEKALLYEQRLDELLAARTVRCPRCDSTAIGTCNADWHDREAALRLLVTPLA